MAKLPPWAAPFHHSLQHHQGGDWACWLRISHGMQSLLVACLTFARAPEDPMPAASGTSPSKGSSEPSGHWLGGLCRVPPNPFMLAFRQPASVRPLEEQNATLMPATGSPAAPRWGHGSERGSPRAMPAARWSWGGWARQPETAPLPAGQGCEDGLPRGVRLPFSAATRRGALR